MALDSIGPYKFQGILGRGGMGTVYRGRHEESGEFHAIKILAPTYAHDPHFRGRFESEIKALIKLDHPNIVRLLSFGQEDGMLFFSMELVEGNSLFHMQKKGHRFDWREIISIARDVSKGLRHAHDRGIIHRDLKPGNLLMTVDQYGEPSGVKITDFGIAKQFGTSMNTGDNVLGTMDFMSPEQGKGEPVTIRSDLYSLGTVLFTLLSGRPPFTANSVEESLRNLTRVPAPRISSLVPDVPKELDDIIKRLMAKRPEDRIQTAQALLHKIEEVEMTLRDNSQAKTIHPNANPHETFDIADPQTEIAPKSKSSKSSDDKTATLEMNKNTVEHTNHGDDNLSQATHVDYFNTVDDEIRKQHVDHIPEAKKGGVIPVALAFVAVVLLGGFGIYQAYQAPSAESLFVLIEENSDRPNQVLDEIDIFLENYPDESRAQKVRELKEVGEAVSLYNSLCNTLTVRSGIKGENRLSEIEQQFLSIVELAEANPAQADAKMAAFVTVHTASNLNPGDQKCVDAAVGYQVKIKNDARTKVLHDLTQIKAAMNEAAKRTDPAGAIPIFESIIELYGDTDWGIIDEADEGRAYVTKARAVLAAMKTAKEKADRGELRPTDGRDKSPNNQN
ncbi:MAG: serine/threonine-protein kinase [Mariniblastus sp.]|nr:serine/threonine-protein kinase [Mariniblastus sp.]